MSPVTIVWSMVASCALLLSLAYAFVWIMDRKAYASLAFACLGLAIVLAVIVELYLMRVSTVSAWAEGVRWTQVPIFLRITATVLFIRLYFGTGRAWLGWLVIAIRGFILVAGFMVDPNFNFARVDSIDHAYFFGELVTVVGRAVPSHWQWLGTAASTLAAIFVADASVKLWRQGGNDARRRAILIGGGTFLSGALGSLYAQLMIWGGLKVPVLLAPPYLFMFFAMTFELSRDTLRASRLARELRDSEVRLQLAASAAGLGLWTWDTEKHRLWATAAAQSMCGLEASDIVDVHQVRSKIHPDDVVEIDREWRQAAMSGAEAEIQFRILMPDRSTRTLAARGRSEADAVGKVTSMKGVLRDVTEQIRAREENEELRRELAHAGRVSVLGTLSSSLAHELSQPLGAIQLNTEAAELLLQRPNPDLVEVRQILADIQRDDRRAAEVIDRLRKLLKRRQMDLVQIPVDGLLQDVASLLKSDAIARKVTLECTCDPGLPLVLGDKVHLSQVLINLVMNGMDAVAEQPPASRRAALHARLDGMARVEISVTDSGPGIPANVLGRIFEPFFTTKEGGMGMGLSVSHTIVLAHSGRLDAENCADGGARFRVVLPAYDPDGQPGQPRSD